MKSAVILEKYFEKVAWISSSQIRKTVKLTQESNEIQGTKFHRTHRHQSYNRGLSSDKGLSVHFS